MLLQQCSRFTTVALEGSGLGLAQAQTCCSASTPIMALYGALMSRGSLRYTLVASSSLVGSSSRHLHSKLLFAHSSRFAFIPPHHVNISSAQQQQHSGTGSPAMQHSNNAASMCINLSKQQAAEKFVHLIMGKGMLLIQRRKHVTAHADYVR